MNDRTMLLDTASLYFRAFHGIPESVKAPDGTPVNAVRGLIDIIAKLVAQFPPSKVVACWDDDWRPAWRVSLVPSYKEHRVIGHDRLVGDVDGSTSVEEMPDALRAQIPLIRTALDHLGVPVVGEPGYEADDVIGTLATLADAPVDIVTGDRDLFQLIDDRRDTRVIYTARGMSNLEIVTGTVLEAKYGVTPQRYVDFAVLRGDPSDGLPGVPGIGEKTAATLLRTHHDLDGIRRAAHDGTGMTANVQRRILASDAYLDVAPAVVRVARDLAIAMPSRALRESVPVNDAQLADFAAQWGLSSSVARLVTAVQDPA